jgi:UDP-glucose 4-epimerase
VIPTLFFGGILRVAITGGAGFIGSNLAELLLREGNEVAVFDNLETGSLDNLEGLDVVFTKGDLCNASDVGDFFRKGRFDYCVHLGAMGSVPRSIENPRGSFEANVIGTFNLLDELRKLDIPVIYSSSSSVYGSNLKLPKTELDWQSPISPYGSYKASSEAMMMAFSRAYDLRVSVFRLFNVYGPRQNPLGAYSAVIPRWTLSGFKKEPITVYGDGNQKRDFTFVADVNQILYKVMKKDGFDPMPVNLAFGSPVTLNEMLDVFREYFDGLQVNYEGPRKGDIRDSESDPTKLNIITGDFVPTTLRDGLFATFDWYKKKHGF